MIPGDRLPEVAALEVMKAGLNLGTLLPDSELQDALALAESFEQGLLLPGLLQVDDRCTASFGMEGRSPFLDQDLWAATARRTLAEKSPPGRATSPVPFGPCQAFATQDCCAPKQAGFPRALEELVAGPLREFALDHLRSRSFLERGLVHPQALDALVEDDRSGGRTVYFMLMLEFWHREFLEGRDFRQPVANAGEVR